MGVSTYLAKVDRLLSEGSVETFKHTKLHFSTIQLQLAQPLRYNAMVELAPNINHVFSTVNIGGMQIPGSDEVIQPS